LLIWYDWQSIVWKYLRRDALLDPLWEDLDVESRIITINKYVIRQDGELLVSEPKTQNSIRKVAVPQLGGPTHHRARERPYKFMSPKTGGMWSPESIARIHKKLLEAAGIDIGVRFHDLRHLYVRSQLKMFLSRMFHNTRTHKSWQHSWVLVFEFSLYNYLIFKASWELIPSSRPQFLHSQLQPRPLSVSAHK